jgi:hypothetical protein
MGPVTGLTHRMFLRRPPTAAAAGLMLLEGCGLPRAVALPTKVARVGYLAQAPREGLMADRVDAFLQGLRQSGWIENQTMSIEWRFSTGLYTKWVELPREVVPGLAHVAVLLDSTNVGTVSNWDQIRIAADQSGGRADAIELRSAEDVEKAFEAAVSSRADAVLDDNSSLVLQIRDRYAAPASSIVCRSLPSRVTMSRRVC